MMSLKTGYRAKRSLGQHFLRDENIARKIVDSCNFQPHDCVVEIGAGEGVLTRLLAPRVGHLTAVEIDGQLASYLRESFHADTRVDIVQADILAVDFSDYRCGEQRIRILGNVPYNISSQIIFHALEQSPVIADMTLMLQKEVAQRVVAAPCSKEYGLLSIHSQVYAEVKLLFTISPQVFRPRPKVDSAMVRWDFSRGIRYHLEDRAFFRQFLKTAFSQRRKMLRNSLKPLLQGQSLAGIELTRRPEELTIDELIMLCNRIKGDREQ